MTSTLIMLAVFSIFVLKSTPLMLLMFTIAAINMATRYQLLKGKTFPFSAQAVKLFAWVEKRDKQIKWFNFALSLFTLSYIVATL